MDPNPYSAEKIFRTLLRRCVVCPEETPQCPPCKSNEVCTQIYADCTQCASRICVPQSQAGTANASGSSGGGPNVGAIVGGVIGGLVFIALVTFLVWRFYFRKRRSQDDEYEDELEFKHEHREPEDPPRRSSMHSVRSVASTVLTRASNVIQIAFIPGITDRSDNNSIPPVPPLPVRESDATSGRFDEGEHPGTPYSDQRGDHYFTAEDLRESRFSNFTDETNTRSRHYSVTSSLARESVASTVFGERAQPVQTALRGKANVVSVKPSNSTSPGSQGTVPDVPAVDYFKYGQLQGDAAPGVAGPSGQDAAVSKKPSARELAAAIQEATQKASMQPMHGGLGSISPRREQSPFDDANAVEDTEFGNQ